MFSHCSDFIYNAWNCARIERERKKRKKEEKKNEVRWKSVCFSRSESRILRSRDIRLHVLPEIGRKIGWKKWKEKRTWKDGCSRFVSNAGRFFFSCRTRKLLASLGFWRRETIKGKMEEKDGERGERMERETFVFIDRSEEWKIVDVPCFLDDTRDKDGIAEEKRTRNRKSGRAVVFRLRRRLDTSALL